MKFIKVYRLSFIGIMTKLFTANICSQKENIVNKVNDLKLKYYRPASIHKIPVRNVIKTKFPVIQASLICAENGIKKVVFRGALNLT